MIDLTTTFNEIRKDVLKPPPKLTLSEWSEQNRILSREFAAEPGHYSAERAPYQKEMLDVCLDPTYEKVVFCVAAQSGKSTVIENVLCYYIIEEPGPMILTLPTIDLARSVSRDRLGAMIRDMPALNELIKEARARDSGNTLNSKKFPGGTLSIIGANSPSALSARSARTLLCDEIDRFPISAGDEGGPLQLLEARTRTFWNRKKIYSSTPTIKGESAIEAEYELSDKRKYYLKCQHCKLFFIPLMEHVQWNKTDNGEHLPHTATLDCPHCEGSHTDGLRYAAIREGMWVIEAPHIQTVAGFWMNSLSSPWVRLDQFVKEYLTAKDNGSQAYKVFHNTHLALTFDEDVSNVKDLDMDESIDTYTPDKLPNEILWLSAGVDVQADRLEMQVLGHTEQEDSVKVVDYIIFSGDTSLLDVWRRLEEHLRTYLYFREDKTPLPIYKTGLDCGYMTEMGYRFAKRNSKYRCFPVAGSASYGNPIFPKRAAKSRTYKGETVWQLGTDTAKTLVYQWIKNGSITFTKYCCDDEYFKQLTVEQVVYRKIGRINRKVFINPHDDRNEALDTFVYALAMKYQAKVNLKLMESKNEKRKRVYWDEQTKVNPLDVKVEVKVDGEKTIIRKPEHLMRNRKPKVNKKKVQSSFVSKLF